MNVFVVSLFCVWLAVNSCVQTGGLWQLVLFLVSGEQLCTDSGLWQLVLCLVSGEQLCTDRRTVAVGIVFG